MKETYITKKEAEILKQLVEEANKEIEEHYHDPNGHLHMHLIDLDAKVDSILNNLREEQSFKMILLEAMTHIVTVVLGTIITLRIAGLV